MSELRLRGDDVAWREVDGELIAVDLPRSTYLGANPSGTLLWSRLANGATRVELAQALVDAYGIDAERAPGDVDAFLRDLSARRLLAECCGARPTSRRSGPPSGPTARCGRCAAG